MCYVFAFLIETFGNKRNVEEIREMLSKIFSETLAEKVNKKLLLSKDQQKG
jgi:hypothetical protein